MIVFQEITDIVFKIELYFQAALLGIIVTAMPPYFAMENAENHKVIIELKLQVKFIQNNYLLCMSARHILGVSKWRINIFNIVITITNYHLLLESLSHASKVTSFNLYNTVM